VLTDYGDEAGGRETRQLLTRPAPPTAIVYDNDVMAVAGLPVTSELGLELVDGRPPDAPDVDVQEALPRLEPRGGTGPAPV
jgi:hypothetical protein